MNFVVKLSRESSQRNARSVGVVALTLAFDLPPFSLEDENMFQKSARVVPPHTLKKSGYFVPSTEY